MNRPTEQTYTELQRALDHFNRELFDDKLPPCIITLQRQQKYRGFFAPKRFISQQGETVDEIALNPGYFAVSSIEEILSTILHEQVHMHEYHNTENNGRRGYHNKHWADKMEAVGLMPSDTGAPGGKRTGERVSHYIIEDGPFAKACEKLLTESFVLSWMDRIPHPVPPDRITKNALALTKRRIETEEEHPPEDAGDEPLSVSDISDDALNADAPSGRGEDVTDTIADSSSSEETSTSSLSDEDAFDGDLEPSDAESSEDQEASANLEHDTPGNAPLSEEDTGDVSSELAPVEEEEEDPVTAMRGRGIELQLIDPLNPAQKRNRSNRLKYTCPQCRTNIWGKPGLNVMCGGCSENDAWVVFESC